MAREKLTDRTVRSAKAKPGERREIWDTHHKGKGLCLRVSETGKTFYFRYRTPDGRQPRIKLKAYSDTFGLAEARKEATRLRLSVEDGEDPAAENRKERDRVRTDALNTFDSVADAFIAASKSGAWMPKNKLKRQRTVADEEGVLRRHVRPVFGRKPIASIQRADVRQFIRDMKGQGIGAQTVRAHAVIRQVFNFAISEEIGGVVLNPSMGFPIGVAVAKRQRVLTDDELRRVWSALRDPAGLRLPPKKGEAEGGPLNVSRQVRIALQLLILLLQRRGEVAGMRASELDLDQGLWLIPSERAKSGRPHLVPLSPLAVELIREALGLVRGDDAEAGHVFASPRTEGHILPNSVTHALAQLYAALGIKGANVHDLRRTGSSALTSERIGVLPFIRSKVLGHSSDSGGGAAVSSEHYDANEYVAAKRSALLAWEGLLLEIAEGRPRADNVLNMAGVA